MSIATAPWSGEATTTPLDSYTTTLEAYAYVTGDTTAYPLTVIDASVDFDAARSPRVHASMKVAWPTAPVRGLLDPRYGLEVEILAGYRFFGTDIEDTQQVTRLRVQEVLSDHAEQTISIDADSDEVVVIGYGIESAVTYTTSSVVLTSIKALVEGAFPGETLTWSIGENVRKQERFLEDQDLTPGQDRWSFVQDWADSIGVVVYHDGLGVWHVENAVPTPSATTVAALTTGPRGTITELRVSESRQGYANRAAAVYEYAVGTASYRQTAIAGTTLTPRTMATQTRAFKPHNAGEVARQMLQRGLRRGHTVEVTAATFLWVRPGFTVTVRLPDGTSDRLLVETAAFNLTDATMTLTGQNADDAPMSSITTTTTTTTL